MKIGLSNPRHKHILQALQARYNMSRRDMEKMHKKWREAEERAVAYIPERDVDAVRRASREAGKPQFTTVAIPMSYATLMAAHTYWTSVFMSRTPVFQYAARHGETPLNEQAVEALIDYQVNVGAMLVPFYIWLLDVGKYGIGILWEYWDQEIIQVSHIVEEEELFMGLIPTGRKLKKKRVQRMPGYQGNRVMNVRPFDYFPDTRVPLWKVQSGEFVARNVMVGWNEVLRRENLGQYYNIKELRAKRRGQTFFDNPGAQVLEMPGQDTTDMFSSEMKDVEFQALVEFVVELVPRDWGLGQSDFPEKWVFTCTRDFDLLIESRPLGALHNKFPVSITELEPEGYALFKRGLMEILQPMQNILDWLINVHFYNVRKAINDTIIIDPSRINMKDVYEPLPGGLWRLRPEGYGTDVRTIAHQLQVVDITQQHVKDSEMISSLMELVSGVNANIMGAVNQGGRKTATEIRTSSSFGINRLKTQAEYFSAMGWAPLSQRLLQNTQQYYDMERKFRIAGDLAELGARREMLVTPEDIQGFYDFVAVDGTLPVDRFAQANLWRGILAEGARYPQILAQYDLSKIFAWIAQLAGLKHINQFRVQIQDDGALAAQAQAGNMVPAGASPNPGGGNAALSTVPEPGQLEGMGATG
jgi:hypothetical protein